MTARTPIIPGFYPDPSICRAGDTYYLVNSSFEYRPGVPIHMSTDLMDWAFVGNALVRESQLPDSDGVGSTGIFAPVLRHHAGRFWLVTTDVVDDDPVQSIQHTESLAGPWSDPVRVEGAVGIDPDLVWDEDACYLTWARFVGDSSSIAQARIDPFTGVLGEEPRRLWSGTGLAFPEGPHVFRRGSWWYLLIAEGGTERGHCVSIARGPSPQGPFVGNPSNPILSHRSTPSPVQNTGHADLVEAPDGSWAMVYLAVRPRGTTPGFHVNGRETFIAGVDWVDDWPVVDESRFPADPADTSFVDEFADDELDGRWISPGIFPSAIADPSDDGLVVATSTAGFLGVRARDASWTAEAEFAVYSGIGSLVVRIDESNAYSVEVGDGVVTAIALIGGNRWQLAEQVRPDGDTVRLRIRAISEGGGALGRGGPDLVELAVHTRDAWHPLGELDGRYLSTEVAGGFTGRVVGIAVRGGRSIVRRFAYTANDH